jgi:hypothetical protein
MASTWGGTAIPDPEVWDYFEELVGQQYVVANGSLVTDSIASKRHIALRWALITTAQKDTLLGLATTQATASLVLIGAAGINVEPVRSTFRASPVGVTPAWNVSCEVRTTA